MYVVRYSFNFRYTPDRRRSVDIPLDRMLGLDLDEDTVSALVKNDPVLNSEMLGDQSEGVNTAIRWEDWKSLERRNQKLEIVLK